MCCCRLYLLVGFCVFAVIACLGIVLCLLALYMLFRMSLCLINSVVGYLVIAVDSFFDSFCFAIVGYCLLLFVYFVCLLCVMLIVWFDYWWFYAWCFCLIVLLEWFGMLLFFGLFDKLLFDCFMFGCLWQLDGLNLV